MYKKYFLIAAGIVIFCFGVNSCICINCCRFNNSVADRQVSIDQPMPEGMIFSVRTSHGFINVTGTDENHCYITAYIRVRAESTEKANEIIDSVKVGFKNSDNQVAIVVDKPKRFRDYGVYISYDIRLPKKTNVNLKTTHEKIECRDLTGNVTASTTHDPIICSAVKGDVNLNTTHDKIRLTDITGKIRARTTHDPIEAERITGPMELSTSHDRIVCREINSQKLRISTSHDNVDIFFSPAVNPLIDANVVTSHGNIVFHLPDSFAGEIAMSTTHGKIRTDVPLVVRGEISENNITGSIGEGAGKVSLKTTHGSINLKKQ